MILETKQEKQAWKFIKKLVSQATERICNDLGSTDVEKFKGLTTTCDDEGRIIQIPIIYDYQVIEWLGNQIN